MNKANNFKNLDSVFIDAEKLSRNRLDYFKNFVDYFLFLIMDDPIATINQEKYVVELSEMNAESKTVVLHNFSEVLHEDGVDIPLISTEEQSFILSNSSVDRRYQSALHKILKYI